jgi:hypothetical protein
LDIQLNQLLETFESRCCKSEYFIEYGFLKIVNRSKSKRFIAEVQWNNLDGRMTWSARCCAAAKIILVTAVQMSTLSSPNLMAVKQSA